MVQGFAFVKGFPIGTDGVPDEQELAILSTGSPSSVLLNIPDGAKGFLVSIQSGQPGCCVEITRDLAVIGIGLPIYRENLPFGVGFRHIGGPGEEWRVNLLNCGDPVNIANPNFEWDKFHNGDPLDPAKGPPYFAVPPPESDVKILVHYFFH